MFRKISVLSAFFLLYGISICLAQENLTIVAPTSEIAEGLDLKAVCELFKESENLEEFEKKLNDPEIGVNNLDLDENGDVDYLRIVEQVADETHVIILQVPLGEDEFQDIATIEVEKSGEENYNMQIHGNEEIYGEAYYIAPSEVHIHVWPIFGWMYRPYYHPYRSAFYFGFYPRWWRPYRPVTFSVYHQRTVRFTTRTTFVVSRTSRVRTVHKVNYRPRSSTMVKKKTTVSRTGAKTTRTKSVTKTTIRGGKSATVKAGVKKTTNPKTGKTTVKAGIKRKKTAKGRTTTVKGGVKRTKSSKRGKTTVKKGAKRTTTRKKKKK